MLSKITTTWYHQIACGRGRVNAYLATFKRDFSDKCRFECHKIETVDHLFSNCPHLICDRTILRDLCIAYDLNYTLKILFTTPKLKIAVEKFLFSVINHND